MAAERPVMVLGGGATDAGPAALDLAELLGAPVVSTVNGKGIVPADHPLSLGARLTLGAVISELEQSDAVIAVGTEFSETDYFFAPRRPRLGESLIRIDIDPAQFACADPRAAVELTGDATEVLSSLVARLKQLLRPQSTRRWRSCIGGYERRSCSGRKHPRPVRMVVRRLTDASRTR